MNNISIESLFPNSKNRIKHGTLDVNTLFPGKSNMNEDEYFDVDELSLVRKEKDKKLKDLFKVIMKQCIDRIKTANTNDYTDIVFEVPKKIYLYPDYYPHTCLQYIEKKLRKLYIDTLIITKNHIFISWLNVDRNKEIEREFD